MLLNTGEHMLPTLCGKLPMDYRSQSMTDTRTAEQRRHIMQAVHTKDTGPEWIVRRLLHGLGYRYRLHPKELPGKPDMSFPARRKVIFMHGCFWHAHGCRYGRPPKSRPEYWLPKLIRNKERDAENMAALQELGWRALVVWQCETKEFHSLTARLLVFLNESPPSRSTSALESAKLLPGIDLHHGEDSECGRLE